MTALAVQIVVTVLVLTVRDMCVTQPVSAPPSFVSRPKALSATECQRLVELGNFCNDGTGVCTLVDGQNGIRLECITPDCGDPCNPANGAVDVSGGTTFPNVITYTCDTGYKLKGAAERTCQRDGTWSGEDPKCLLTNCGHLCNPENGVVDVSGGTKFPNVITYTCDTGYTLNGAAERTCQSDGTWSGEEPTCVLTDCGDPGNPENGTVDVSGGTTFQNVITYTCDTGYTLNGAAERTCQCDGTWSGEEPTCVLTDCEDPGNLENGTVDVSRGTTFPNVITYTCDTGYTLYGAVERTCQSNGIWSDKEPTCLTTPPMPPCFDAQFNYDYFIDEGLYSNNLNLLGCFLAPVGTSITVTFLTIELECERGTAVCDDIHNCQFDWIQVIDNGTFVERICGTAVSEYVISGLSNDVKIWLVTDDVGQFNGENTKFYLTYA